MRLLPVVLTSAAIGGAAWRAGERPAPLVIALAAGELSPRSLKGAEAIVTARTRRRGYEEG